MRRAQRMIRLTDKSLRLLREYVEGCEATGLDPIDVRPDHVALMRQVSGEDFTADRLKALLTIACMIGQGLEGQPAPETPGRSHRRRRRP